jgi:hypothetical protein
MAVYRRGKVRWYSFEFQASTRLMATASTSSRMPSCSRKLSKVDPLWSAMFRFFLDFIGFPF